MTMKKTDEARASLREAVRNFAKAQRLPIEAPEELIELETSDMPQGQAQAELLVAYFDLRKRSTLTFTVPTNEAALVQMVRDVIGHPENEHELTALNPRSGTPGRPSPNEQHRRVVDALLDGRFEAFLADEVELRKAAIAENREKRANEDARRGVKPIA